MDQFSVYIIESPSPRDNLDGRNEREPLSGMLKAIGLESKSYYVLDDYELTEAILDVGAIFAAQESRFYPIIHFSAHGTNEGIKLTNGLIFWADLAERLVPLNAACQGELIVAMSTCYGYQGFNMGGNPDKKPFRSIIGPATEPTWQDALLGYACLYHLLAKKWPGTLVQIVEKMNHAAGTENLFNYAILTDTFDQKIAKRREFEYKFEAIKSDPEKFKKFVDGMSKRIAEIKAAREASELHPRVK